MSDPLSLVREATISKQPVKYESNHYIFGQIKLHESTKTCFKRTLQKSDAFRIDVPFSLTNSICCSYRC